MAPSDPVRGTPRRGTRTDWQARRLAARRAARRTGGRRRRRRTESRTCFDPVEAEAASLREPGPGGSGITRLRERERREDNPALFGHGSGRPGPARAPCSRPRMSPPSGECRPPSRRSARRRVDACRVPRRPAVLGVTGGEDWRSRPRARPTEARASSRRPPTRRRRPPAVALGDVAVERERLVEGFARGRQVALGDGRPAQAVPGADMLRQRAVARAKAERAAAGARRAARRSPSPTRCGRRRRCAPGLGPAASGRRRHPARPAPGKRARPSPRAAHRHRAARRPTSAAGGVVAVVEGDQAADAGGPGAQRAERLLALQPRHRRRQVAGLVQQAQPGDLDGRVDLVGRRDVLDHRLQAGDAVGGAAFTQRDVSHVVRERGGMARANRRAPSRARSGAHPPRASAAVRAAMGLAHQPVEALEAEGLGVAKVEFGSGRGRPPQERASKASASRARFGGPGADSPPGGRAPARQVLARTQRHRRHHDTSQVAGTASRMRSVDSAWRWICEIRPR